MFEAGTKIDLFNDAVYLQLAAYQINKTDVLVEDPTPGAPTGALSTIGEARSRGIELDVVGDLTDDWTFTFSYAFNDTVILEGADEIINAVGDEFANAPDHQVGFWTRYDITPINSAIAFGGQYVSEQISLSGQRVRPYAVFDASWITTWRNLQFQINARNLFDKVYAESGFLARTGPLPRRAENLPGGSHGAVLEKRLFTIERAPVFWGARLPHRLRFQAVPVYDAGLWLEMLFATFSGGRSRISAFR